MNNINDLREELKRRREAQPVPEPGKLSINHVMLSSLTLVVLVVAAVNLF